MRLATEHESTHAARELNLVKRGDASDPFLRRFLAKLTNQGFSVAAQ